MKVQEIMTANPQSVTPETTIREAAQLMKSADVGVLPVVESGSSSRLIGVVTDRDITIRIVAEGRTSASVSDAMTSGVATCRADDDVKDVMAVMGREQVRRIPVVDDRGNLLGIVAQADLVLEADDKRAEETIEQISQRGGSHSH